MPHTPEHRAFAADAHAVPRPFRTFAVRSDEAQHASSARAPFGHVHLVRPALADAGALAALAARGRARTRARCFSDIDYAATSWAELAGVAPGLSDRAGGLPGLIASALRLTGVLGAEPDAYRRSLDSRVDHLAACGAGFHNDVGRHWSRCLFWLLALELADVEFVMPHAGLRVPLAPGDLLVFDPSMAHGLCRPRDAGQALAQSLSGGDHPLQLFLTGELLLADAQWAALGSPWLPVEVHAQRGALDLMAAEFDERTGAIQRPLSLRHGMQRSTCYVDAAADDDA